MFIRRGGCLGRAREKKDDHELFKALDPWGQLNVEADLLAKSLIPTAKVLPRNQSIPSELWQLWFASKKLLDIQSQIYDIVHSSKDSQKYWCTKGKVNTNTIDSSTGLFLN